MSPHPHDQLVSKKAGPLVGARAQLTCCRRSQSEGEGCADRRRGQRGLREFRREPAVQVVAGRLRRVASAAADT